MNSGTLAMHHMLNDAGRVALNFQYNDFSAEFSQNGVNWKELKLVKNVSLGMGLEYKIDNDDEWDPGKCFLRIRQKFTLSNLAQLFSSKNVPINPSLHIALPTDKIGIAAIWWSDQTKTRGTTVIGSFDYESSSNMRLSSFHFEEKYQPGVLGGQLFIQYILYLKEPGLRISPGFSHIAGTTLGAISEQIVFNIDGNMSSFPISKVHIDYAPLWWIDFNIEDPFNDGFEEDYINLVLNTAHKDYAAIGEDKGYNTALFREIIAGALEELFIEMGKYDNELKGIDPKDVLPGTIAYAIMYMKRNFNIRTDTYKDIHNTVRSFVKEHFGGK